MAEISEAFKSTAQNQMLWNRKDTRLARQRQAVPDVSRTARYPRLELCLNDLDSDLSAFWRVVAGDDVEALCDRLALRPTIDPFLRASAQCSQDWR
jgi:hypothetical protein